MADQWAGRFSGDLVLRRCSKWLQVPVEELVRRRRLRSRVRARFVAMATVRQHTDLSLAEIASLFHMHHTTVIYALREVEKDEGLRGMMPPVEFVQRPDE